MEQLGAAEVACRYRLCQHRQPCCPRRPHQPNGVGRAAAGGGAARALVALQYARQVEITGLQQCAFQATVVGAHEDTGRRAAGWWVHARAGQQQPEIWPQLHAPVLIHKVVGGLDWRQGSGCKHSAAMGLARSFQQARQRGNRRPPPSMPPAPLPAHAHHPCARCCGHAGRRARWQHQWPAEIHRVRMGGLVGCNKTGSRAQHGTGAGRPAAPRIPRTIASRRAHVSWAADAALRLAACSTSYREPRAQYSVISAGGSRHNPASRGGWMGQAGRAAAHGR